MNQSLRISIADDDSTQRVVLKEMLQELGHTVVSEARSDEELIRDLNHEKPDVAVADLDMPERNHTTAPSDANEEDRNGTPVVVTTDRHGPHKVNRALQLSNVVGYLAKPFGSSTLDGVLRFAYGLFGRFHGLQSRLNEFQRSLANREVIEKAKQILMKRTNLSESEAHRKLQKMASSSNKKLAELAQSIVDAAELEKN